MDWFKIQRNKSIPISGPFLQAKAEFYQNKSLTKGWLFKFLKRNKLTSKVICGEELSVDTVELNNWRKNTLSPKIKEFKDTDIYNCDESALFFKKTPTRTYDTKGSFILKWIISKIIMFSYRN